MSNQQPTAIALFPNVGGISLGIENAGFDVAMAIICDPFDAVVHKFNFPHILVELSGEENIDVERVLNRSSIAGNLNLVTLNLLIDTEDRKRWGVPIKGIQSTTRERIQEGARFCAISAPDYIWVESPVGMNFSARAFLENEFSKAGYDFCICAALNCQDYTIAQDKKRLNFIFKRRTRVLNQDFSFSKIVTLKNRASANSVLYGLSELEDEPVNDEIGLGNYLSGQRIPDFHFYQPSGEGGRNTMLFSTLRKPIDYFTNHAAVAGTNASRVRFSNLEVGGKDFLTGRVKLYSSHPAQALDDGFKELKGYLWSLPIHYHHPRAITIREAARLQSFPDWFRFSDNRFYAAKQVCLSTPPVLAYMIATEIRQSLPGNKLVIVDRPLGKNFESLELINSSSE